MPPKEDTSKPAPKPNYIFCQYINPALGHDNSPCTCFESAGPHK
jgi:hypothetical protein